MQSKTSCSSFKFLASLQHVQPEQTRLHSCFHWSTTTHGPTSQLAGADSRCGLTRPGIAEGFQLQNETGRLHRAKMLSRRGEGGEPCVKQRCINPWEQPDSICEGKSQLHECQVPVITSAHPTVERHHINETRMGGCRVVRRMCQLN